MRTIAPVIEEVYIEVNMIDKELLFITGQPRSGTSLLTKVVDTHPKISILMENGFGCCRRLRPPPKHWESDKALLGNISPVFGRLKTPIVGNKIGSPNIWGLVDICQFVRQFVDFKILLIIRNPILNAISRCNRETPEGYQWGEYSQYARDSGYLDFRSQAHNYISSWLGSIDIYWKLKHAHQNKVYLVYYDDFCVDFENNVKKICNFLGVDFTTDMLNWYTFKHHNAGGELVKDLKYPDKPVFYNSNIPDVLPKRIENLPKLLDDISDFYKLWENRGLEIEQIPMRVLK